MGLAFSGPFGGPWPPRGPQSASLCRAAPGAARVGLGPVPRLGARRLRSVLAAVPASAALLCRSLGPAGPRRLPPPSSVVGGPCVVGARRARLGLGGRGLPARALRRAGCVPRSALPGPRPAPPELGNIKRLTWCPIYGTLVVRYSSISSTPGCRRGLLLPPFMSHYRACRLRRQGPWLTGPRLLDRLHNETAQPRDILHKNE